MRRKTSFTGPGTKEPDPPFPLPPEKEDERIPVPPSDIVPEPLNLPSDDEPQPPIGEKQEKPKVYL